MALKLSGEVKTGRVVRNIADGPVDPASPLTGWTAVGPTFIAYEDDGYSAVFTLDANDASQRGFLNLTVAVTAGRFYAFRMTVSEKSGTFGRENIDVVSSIVSSPEVNNIENGERAVVVEANATGNCLFRVGFGIDNNDTSATDGATFKISNVQIEELPVGQSVPSEQVNVTQKRELPSSPLYDTGNNRFTVGFAQDVLGTLGTPASGGLLTESYSGPYSFVNNFGITCITDSFGDENDEFVRLYETANPDKFVNAVSKGGTRLNQVTNQVIEGALTQGSIYNALAAQSGIIVIQRCVNDIFADETAVDIYAVLEGLVTYAKTNGITVVVANCPPFGDYGSYTAARETQALAYNVLVEALAASDDQVFLFDVFDVMEEPGTFTIKAAYDADGLHPNAAGSAALAAELETVIDTITNRVVSTVSSGSGSSNKNIISRNILSR